jgi:hypothetical protein
MFSAIDLLIVPAAQVSAKKTAEEIIRCSCGKRNDDLSDG